LHRLEVRVADFVSLISFCLGREVLTSPSSEAKSNFYPTPLARRRRRWEDNIKMGLEETGYEDMHWIHPIRDVDKQWAVVNTVMKLGVA
jgi:hypothetical protein